jgi:hypothetical protein
MKNLFLALGATFLLSFSFVTNADAVTKTTTTTSSPGWFSAGSFGCWGWGHCTTTTTTSLSTITNNGDGTVTIRWDYNAFNDKNKEYYKGATLYQNKNETPMSDEDCKGLGLKLGTIYTIGDSPITWADQFMIVTCNIK